MLNEIEDIYNKGQRDYEHLSTIYQTFKQITQKGIPIIYSSYNYKIKQIVNLLSAL
ncbi:hypothetical protein SAMN05444362_102479 [Dysgonomonas macrotermitis]|uniref:Uncharacterized protein n=1 Tax=Dysgonomonas macrotermitis TaxID=1346286 RepID=A0A1M4XDJ9_9BACT|nr:hypothetical protein SAMN05444362_102479 [Dysgonomonas macrotermitis]